MVLIQIISEWVGPWLCKWLPGWVQAGFLFLLFAVIVGGIAWTVIESWVQ